MSMFKWQGDEQIRRKHRTQESQDPFFHSAPNVTNVNTVLAAAKGNRFGSYYKTNQGRVKMPAWIFRLLLCLSFNSIFLVIHFYPIFIKVWLCQKLKNKQTGLSPDSLRGTNNRVFSLRLKLTRSSYLCKYTYKNKHKSEYGLVIRDYAFAINFLSCNNTTLIM